MPVLNTNYNHLDFHRGGTVLGTNVGDTLNILRNYFNGLVNTRWQEVTNAAPTPAFIQQFHSVWTPGTNAGTEATQQITYFLKDDPGLLMTPPQVRLMRLSKIYGTMASHSILVNVREAPHDTTWGGHSPTGVHASQALFAAVNNPRFFIVENQDNILFASADVDSESRGGIVTYPDHNPAMIDPVAMSHIGVSVGGADTITGSTHTDQPVSLMMHRSSRPSALFLRPALGGVRMEFDTKLRVVFQPVLVSRLHAAFFVSGFLDQILTTTDAHYARTTVLSLEGRRYMKMFGVLTQSGGSLTMSIWSPVELAV